MSVWQPAREQKPLPLRVRRRRTRLLWAVALLALVSALGLLLHWVSYLPFVSISEINVDGAYKVSPEEVRATVRAHLASTSGTYLSRSNIFLYDQGAIADAIVDALPRIKSVDIRRKSLLSRTLLVSVSERTPVARWCAVRHGGTTEPERGEETCYQMDETGFLFADTSASPRSSYGTPYVFYGGIATTSASRDYIGETFMPEDFPDMLAVLQAIQRSGSTPTALVVENEQDYRVELAAGYFLRLSFGQDAETLVRNLTLLLASETLSGKESRLEYIDLRFGNRAYYKF